LKTWVWPLLASSHALRWRRGWPEIFAFFHPQQVFCNCLRHSSVIQG
jgi:hypothetical protein